MVCNCKLCWLHPAVAGAVQCVLTVLTLNGTIAARQANNPGPEGLLMGAANRLAAIILLLAVGQTAA